MSADPGVRDLVQRAQKGGRSAFDRLVSLQRTRLRSVVEQRLGAELRGRLAADDVVQETLLRAWQALPRFEWKDTGSFQRWLNGIAVNVILEEVKRPGKGRLIALEQDIPATAPSPGKMLEREERWARLKKALDELTPDQREAVILMRIEGNSVAEAARLLGRSSNAVSLLLLRALRGLRDVMGDTGSFGLPDRPLGEGPEK